MQLDAFLDCMAATVMILRFVCTHSINSILKNLNFNYIASVCLIMAALELFDLVSSPDGSNYFETDLMKN